MKFLAPILSCIVCASVCVAEPSYITIGPLKLVAAYTPNGSPDQLREYLPPGDHFENWTRMASVRVFTNWRDPDAYLSKFGPWITRKDPAAKYQLLRKSKDGPLILDFVVYSYKNGVVEFLEWNLMKAHFEEKRGLILDQYAMRIYNPELDSAKAIIAERIKMLDAFADASFEENTGPNQLPEPASRSVTPPAGAGGAPSVAAAH